MKRFLVYFILPIFILVFENAVVLAAPNWITMDDKPIVTYQVDTETIRFLGDEPDKQLSVWMKSIEKSGALGYMVAHYLVKENLNFVLLERSSYSVSGQLLDTFTNKSPDKWTETTKNSPIGSIATRLYVDYRKDPDAFKNNTLQNSLTSTPVTKNESSASSQIVVDPQEVKKALEDDRIKFKETDGSRNYYVRARQGAHLFSRETDQFDFGLSFYPNNSKSTILKVSIRISGTGASMKEGVTVVVDGRSWHLAPPISDESSGSYGNITFKYSFNMTDSLVQALATAKGPVSVKWKYKIGAWEEREFVVQDKSLHDIQLMYLGCK